MNRYIEESNYHNDHRVRGLRNSEQGTPSVIHETEKGETVIELPTKWEICPTCNGEGKHVNPSIDCNGLTAEDFAEDPDFRDDYLSGTYNVPCYECNGRSSVQVVDRKTCDPERLKAYDDQQSDLADMYAGMAAERRMGA